MSLSSVVSDFFRRRVLHPVSNLLKQGMTPHKLAVTIALGTAIGIIPAFGVTTVIATAIAARFRLNIAATVLVGYLVHPLQLLLIIPFVRMGIYLFDMQDLRLTLEEMVALFKADWLEAFNALWKANLAAVSAWAIVAIPVGVALYLLVLPLLKKVLPKPVEA